MDSTEHFELSEAQLERIQCSAIHYNDGKKSHIEGFLTNKNRFVDRVEGYQIAMKENQLLDGEGNGEFLYSEDIY